MLVYHSRLVVSDFCNTQRNNTGSLQSSRSPVSSKWMDVMHPQALPASVQYNRELSSSGQLHQVSNGHQIPSVLQFHEHLYWPSSRSVLAWRWPAGKGVVFWRSVMNKKVMHESVLANHYTAVGERSQKLKFQR